jgi:hypothetical protein
LSNPAINDHHNAGRAVGTPAAGIVGQAYSFTPTVTGGSGGNSFAVNNTTGTLAALGLSFSASTGAITGTPSVAGTWSGTIKVTDTGGGMATSATLSVVVSAPQVSISGGPSGANAISGSSGTVIAASAAPTVTGATGTKTFSLMANGTALTSPGTNLGGVCPGLSFSTSTGVISGTPTQACNTDGAILQIKVSDSGTGTSAVAANIFGVSRCGPRTA